MLALVTACGQLSAPHGERPVQPAAVAVPSTDDLMTGTYTVNGASFAADPLAAAGAAVSATTAYSGYEGEAIPAGVQVGYGNLTKELSVGNYVTKDKPVWAYSWPGCLAESPALGASDGAEPTSCVTWLFLDAQDGSEVLETDQPTSGTGAN